MHNKLINLLKWPVVVCLTAFAWFAAGQIPMQVMALARLKTVWIPLMVGVLCYLIAWRFWLRRSHTVVWAVVLEHELTHALASLLTFNGVRKLLADSSGSGHIAVNNCGNWIISCAPYVIPSALLVPGLLIATSLPGWFSYGLFGVACGFHLQSTFTETHLGQTDLKELGWPTAALLLPTCHVIVVLLTVGFLLGHQSGTAQAWAHTKGFVQSSVSRALPVGRHLAAQLLSKQVKSLTY